MHWDLRPVGDKPAEDPGELGIAETPDHFLPNHWIEPYRRLPSRTTLQVQSVGVGVHAVSAATPPTPGRATPSW